MTGCPDSGPFSGLLDYISRQFSLDVLTLGPFQVFLTISLDNLVPLDASPVGDPLLDDVERERSDPGRGDTAIYRRCMARNRSGLLGRP